MTKRQELINMSKEAGINAFGIFGCAPYLNKEFIKIVPNCAFGDDKGCRLRKAMYRSYIDGWTQANLAQ